jgi:MFS family permease
MRQDRANKTAGGRPGIWGENHVSAATEAANAPSRSMTRGERKVIFASSLGTVFEWYDFYLYGSLATIIGANFFSQFDPATRNIFALLAFAAGFLVRPFGALVFGRLGDLVGRKYTFLVTIVIMGTSTFLVGILPTSEQIGISAAIILIILRLLQGLALGGEYGGAATYVAEHAPQGRRGFYTSFIQTTATLGLFLSLVVILLTRTLTGEADFAAWGWRIPFLVSVLLLGISIWIRLQLEESPAFVKMKEEGTGSKAPLSEAFGTWRNGKIALIALLGLTAGQGVVWYTGQFYALFFLQSILKVDGTTANLLIAWSLILGTGGFILFGWLSDKIGRKPIILAGCALAAATYFPLFNMMTREANPALYSAQQNIPVTVVANPADCNFLFNPVAPPTTVSSCDIAKQVLAGLSVPYRSESAPAGTIATVRVGTASVPSFNAREAGAQAVPLRAAFVRDLTAALTTAGYPSASNPSVVRMAHPFDIFREQTAVIIGILFILVVYVTMVYGPIAAALVELFPTRIRYSGMSLPYHIGNGWFGGLLPATAFALIAATGDIYYGLWYPIVFACMTVVIGIIFVPETKDRDIFAEDNR